MPGSPHSVSAFRADPLEDLKSTRALTAEKRPRESLGEEAPTTRPKITERRPKKTISEAAPPVAGILTSAGDMTAGGSEEYSEMDDGSLFGGSSMDMIKRAYAAIKNNNAIATSSTSKLNKADTSNIATCNQDIFAVIAVLQIKLTESEAKVASTRNEITSILAEAPTVITTADMYAAKLKLPRQALPMEMPRVRGPVLDFYPTTEEQGKVKTAEDTKQELKSAIDPRKINIQVEKLRKVGNDDIHGCSHKIKKCGTPRRSE
ncbi:hypothetical protein EVAR_85151_1 [Eumeta japonica]|uniref:Uncharacterized protein n=1 Tax=Eumeta variegata TaxID=151549 RepID=A0A4C1XS56_EUMVA|nr:hypothetical protein EVAR_85151_1 [Eumeta japonica]